jgi:hypothetical protein
MWDLRGRDPKWKRRVAYKAARKTCTPYEEKPRPVTCDFKVFTPYELWKQQKDRLLFKGPGRIAAFHYDPTEQVEAMRKYMLNKAKDWVKPYGFESADWTEKKTFEEMVYWITKPSRPMAKPKIQIKGHLCSITGGAFVDATWIIDHLDKCERKKAWEATRLIRDEEQEWNVPDPEGSQARYNYDYMMRYLVELGHTERIRTLGGLIAKFGARDVWEGCHWGLKHRAFPGMELVVEKVER